jgi:tetratricopeptide (TPR) repeat protein
MIHLLVKARRTSQFSIVCRSVLERLAALNKRPAEPDFNLDEDMRRTPARPDLLQQVRLLSGNLDEVVAAGELSRSVVYALLAAVLFPQPLKPWILENWRHALGRISCDLHQDYLSLLDAALQENVPDLPQRERCWTVVREKLLAAVDSIVVSQRRHAYDTAAENLALLALILTDLGRRAEAEALFQDAHSRYPRHSSFRAEVRKAKTMVVT